MGISPKQKKILAFSYTKKYQALICDGAVRSGKTSLMTVAFVDWAMREFDNTCFAICGKTVGSAIKNIIVPYMALEYAREKYSIHFTRADNKMIVRRGGRQNVFYVYGGKDESSYMLIQGITLAGVLLDEVALMTRSFVEQALARCLSFKNRRYWFNCNPENPSHWFYTEWIQKPEEHRALHLHFLMADNPMLDDETLREAEQTWSGVFYQRYVLGQWVLAEGLIYPNGAAAVVPVEERQYTEYRVAVDYGIYNPMAFALFGLCGGVWYMVKEYYHSGRDTKQPKTDEAYYRDLDDFIGGVPVRMVIVDPSAASFITLIQARGKYRVLGANNAVMEGISLTLSALENGGVKINECCVRMLAEFGEYRWDEKEQDKPVKVSDHLCDALRYFVMSVYGSGRAQAAGRLGLG